MVANWKVLVARIIVCLLIVPLLLTPLGSRVRSAEIRAPATIATMQTSAKLSQQTNPPLATPAGSPDLAIPLPEIADRAGELDRLLQDILSQLVPTSELMEEKRMAETHGKEIRERTLQADALLDSRPTLLEFEDEQRYWNSRSLESSAQRKRLTKLAAKMTEEIHILEAQQPEWQATWDQIHQLHSIDAVVDRVRQELDAIKNARAEAQAQLSLVVDIQNQISRQDQQISDVLLQIHQVADQERSRVLEPDSRPLWENRALRQLDAARYSPGRYFDRSFRAGNDFLRENKLAAFSFAALYVLALLGIFKIRYYIAHSVRSANAPPIMGIFATPFSVALLIALLGTGGTFASAPIGLAALFCLLYIIPVMRLLRPLIDLRLRPLLYFVAVFYAIEGFYLSIQLPPLIKRELYAVVVFAALVSLLWLSRLSRPGSLLPEDRTRQILILGIRGGLLLLATSLVANIVGYVFLAQVLGLFVFIGPFLATGFYSGALVLILVLNTVLHSRWAAEFSETSIEQAERWGGRLLALGTFLLWARTILLLFRIYDSIMIAVDETLQHPIGFEKFRFTLGGALGVVVVLLAGYIFANALNFFLRRVVLPKLNLHRGVPDAIATIGHYVLLLVVGLIALSTAGVELNRFTVLTGALGVGLGFGLQNIVNNFVSGLILLVERPIHIGDTIDIGGMSGTVRRMGTRSSTVLTPQGAEVIVPNSNLISNQVVNWTLSSPWRRVDVPIGVSFGTDPERVIKLLVRVAASQPGVLLEPPPTGFFLGFGESALQFALHFWSARQDTWLQLQSDVTIAVARALREADIGVPFPQRDLHVRIGPTSFTEALVNSDLRMTSVDAESQRVRK